MKPTKEQIIGWALAVADSDKVDPVSTGGLFVTLTPEELQRFTTIAYAKGQEDMRDRAAKVCGDLERAFWESVSDIAQNKGRIAFAGPAQCATGIRALPILKGGKG